MCGGVTNAITNRTYRKASYAVPPNIPRYGTKRAANWLIDDDIANGSASNIVASFEHRWLPF